MHKCLSVCENIFREGDNILFTPFTALLHVATSYCSFLSFQLRNLQRIQFTLSCYNVRESEQIFAQSSFFVHGFCFYFSHWRTEKGKERVSTGDDVQFIYLHVCISNCLRILVKLKYHAQLWCLVGEYICMCNK